MRAGCVNYILKATLFNITVARPVAQAVMHTFFSYNMLINAAPVFEDCYICLCLNIFRSHGTEVLTSIFNNLIVYLESTQINSSRDDSGVFILWPWQYPLLTAKIL